MRLKWRKPLVSSPYNYYIQGFEKFSRYSIVDILGMCFIRSKFIDMVSRLSALAYYLPGLSCHAARLPHPTKQSQYHQMCNLDLIIMTITSNPPMHSTTPHAPLPSSQEYNSPIPLSYPAHNVSCISSKSPASRLEESSQPHPPSHIPQA